MGAVHLFYDPDFKDRNDFRNDLRKIALSPGPGAHKDPLNSFKFVINQNGKYSIPKVSLFPHHNDRRNVSITRSRKYGTLLHLTPTTLILLIERWCSANQTSICSPKPVELSTPDSVIITIILKNFILDAFECTSILEKGCAMHIWGSSPSFDRDPIFNR